MSLVHSRLGCDRGDNSEGGPGVVYRFRAAPQQGAFQSNSRVDEGEEKEGIRNDQRTRGLTRPSTKRKEEKK